MRRPSGRCSSAVCSSAWAKSERRTSAPRASATLGVLRLIPIPIEDVERKLALLREPSVRLVDTSLDVCEPFLEFPHRASERSLGVDVVMTRHVDNRVQRIAKLGLHFVGITAFYGAIELGKLFIHLRPRTHGIRPVEAYAPDLLAHPLRAHERRKALRHGIEHAAPLGLVLPLTGLDPLPVVEDPLGRALPLDRQLTKDMRVPSYELVANRRDDVIRSESSFCARKFTEKHHLKEQVTELLLQLAEVVAIDRIDHLGSLFEHVLSDALEGLFPIPGTAVGFEQASHELNEARVGIPPLLGERGRFDRWEWPRHTSS